MNLPTVIRDNGWPVKDSILDRASKPDPAKTSPFDWAASGMVMGHEGSDFPAEWSSEPWPGENQPNENGKDE